MEREILSVCEEALLIGSSRVVYVLLENGLNLAELHTLLAVLPIAVFQQHNTS